MNRCSAEQTTDVPRLRIFSPSDGDHEYDDFALPCGSSSDDASVPDNFDQTAHDSAMADFSLTAPVSRFSKRLLDICLSLPMVVVLLPPLAVLVRLGHLLQSPGPLFFRQERCGRNQQKFTILKFRTMDVPGDGASDVEDNPEPRIFPIGRILRNTKLDEIPQFVNVLLGSMSVVGPRPHHFEDCRRFGEAVEDYSQRTIAKPGITGLAQYTEYRGDFEWNCVKSRVEKDLGYIHNWSLTLDLKLIVKTANVILQKSTASLWQRSGSTASEQPLTKPVTLEVFPPVTSTAENADAVKPNDEATTRRAA